MGHLISLEGVGVDRGGTPVLRGVDLEVSPSDVVGVAGPNGSGKTTLLRLIATLLSPSSGRGSVLGAGLGSPQVYPIRHRIGMISHTPALVAELTQRENLVHFCRLRGIDEDGIDRTLRVVGLDEASGRRAEASSYGMLRRIEVARLLLAGPSVLLLDEAFSGLDAEAQQLIGALIRRTTTGQGAVVMVSHDTAQLEAHADRVLLLRSGHIEEAR